MAEQEYGLPGLRVAEGHAANDAAVYRYRLTYPAPGGPFKGYTPHALDVPLTFEHLDDPAFAAFFGLTPADRLMAEMMHSAVVAFVRDGLPAAPGLPAWPNFDDATRLTMVLDAHPGIDPDPDHINRLLWEG